VKQQTAQLAFGFSQGCWLVERFCLSDAPLPAIQSAICIESLGRLGMLCSCPQVVSQNSDQWSAGTYTSQIWQTSSAMFSLRLLALRIGLACTIIDWAGPTPYDDMRLGFASQTAGAQLGQLLETCLAAVGSIPC